MTVQIQACDKDGANTPRDASVHQPGAEELWTQRQYLCHVVSYGALNDDGLWPLCGVIFAVEGRIFVLGTKAVYKPHCIYTSVL